MYQTPPWSIVVPAPSSLELFPSPLDNPIHYYLAHGGAITGMHAFISWSRDIIRVIIRVCHHGVFALGIRCAGSLGEADLYSFSPCRPLTPAGSMCFNVTIEDGI
jgi:hypothetical protein